MMSDVARATRRDILSLCDTAVKFYKHIFRTVKRKMFLSRATGVLKYRETYGDLQSVQPPRPANSRSGIAASLVLIINW